MRMKAILLMLLNHSFKNNYAGNREFYSDMVPDLQHPFMFSPGHRVRICSFISEVKHKYCANQRKDKHFINSSPKI